LLSRQTGRKRSSRVSFLFCFFSFDCLCLCFFSLTEYGNNEHMLHSCSSTHVFIAYLFKLLILILYEEYSLSTLFHLQSLVVVLSRVSKEFTTRRDKERGRSNTFSCFSSYFDISIR
jgi:hypothetical protein